jgi:hypothetical protein
VTARLRALAVLATTALAVTVALPGSAASATVPGCHLSGPTKVVVDSPSEEVTWGFGPDCMEVTNGGGATATWELFDPSDTLVHTIGVEIPDPLAYEDSLAFADTDPMGQYVIRPTGIDPSWLTQNYMGLEVRYASALTATVTRTSSTLTWHATATQWSGRSHATVVRPDVRVGLFHQVTSRSAWQFVKSVRTSSTGRATLSLSRPESGNYRLVIGETKTVWAAYSRTIAGRV